MVVTRLQIKVPNFFWLTVSSWRDKQNIEFDPDHAVVVELGLKYQV
jgi:hypothetical protein